MTAKPWGVQQDPQEAFDAFVGALNRAIANCLPGDYWAALAVCRACSAPLCQHGISAHMASMPKLPVLPSDNGKATKKDLEAGPPCPACGAALDVGCLGTQYYGRVPMLTLNAIVQQVEVGADGKDVPHIFVFRPPSDWQEIPANAPPGSAVQITGRTIHPVLAMLRALSEIKPEEPQPIKMISPETAVCVYYRGDDEEKQAVASRLAEMGFNGATHMRRCSPGQVPPAIQVLGGAATWAQLEAGRNLGLWVFSFQDAIFARIQHFCQIYGAHSAPKPGGRFEVSGQGKRFSFSLDEIIDESASNAFTVDEVLFDKGFWEMDPDPEVMFSKTGLRPDPPSEDGEAQKRRLMTRETRKMMAEVEAARGAREAAPAAAPAAPRPPPVPAPTARPPPIPAPSARPPPVSAPAARPPPVMARPAPVQPAAVARPVAPAAPPVAPRAAGPPQGPWSVCRTCGRPSQLRRRLYEKDHMQKGGTTQWIETGKQIGLTIALAWGCPDHVEVLNPYATSGWGVPQEQLAMTAHLSVPFDVVQVHRRLVFDKKGRPCVGYVGRYASSLVSDDRWLQAAWVASGQEPTELTANSRGEHAIAIAAKEGAWYEVGGVSKEMLKLAVQMGLPKATVAGLWTYKSKGFAPPAGIVQVLGDV